MSGSHYSGYVLCSLTLSLFVSACRRNSEFADYPIQSSDSNIEQHSDNMLPKRLASKPQVLNHVRKKHIGTDTPHSVSTQSGVDTTITYLSSDNLPTTKKDSERIKRFYLEQSLANSIRAPSFSINRPSVHPDSQTWEQISGVQKLKEKTPDWKIALGYLRIVATILGLVYIIFFDN